MGKSHDIAEILLKLALNTNQTINGKEPIDEITVYTRHCFDFNIPWHSSGFSSEPSKQSSF